MFSYAIRIASDGFQSAILQWPSLVLSCIENFSHGAFQQLQRCTFTVLCYILDVFPAIRSGLRAVLFCGGFLAFGFLRFYSSEVHFFFGQPFFVFFYSILLNRTVLQLLLQRVFLPPFPACTFFGVTQSVRLFRWKLNACIFLKNFCS